ncbi:MAG: hypothetical protein GKR92_02105 [Gammaproteobacteria bacterium]|nr:MAG: hypothetical protein GKR92_02105 [Gammaproteobacteria bacterium]
MADVSKQYPKLLAFLQLFYPTLYNKLSLHSQKADIVEAKLICSNNAHSYQAIIYSEDIAKDGELLEVYAGKDSIAPYSWDWRWVFAVKVLFSGNDIFPIKFKQKVIALPTGKNPLSDVFFKIIREDFEMVFEELLKQSTQEKISIRESYSKYLISIKL